MQTTEQIEQKAKQLSEQYGVEVIPMAFTDADSNEQIVGYLKSPDRLSMMRAFDKMISSPSMAGAEILEICLIKNESDPRIYTEAPQNNSIYLGAIVEALSVVKLNKNTLKKK